MIKNFTAFRMGIVIFTAVTYELRSHVIIMQRQARVYPYAPVRFEKMSMHRSGTRIEIQLSKTKREITKITNSQNTREHMVNLVGSYLTKVGHFATQTELK